MTCVGLYQRIAYKEFAKARERPPAAPLRCRCGLTADQVPGFWCYKGERFDPVRYYCPACAPPRTVSSMLTSTINSPDAYLPEDAPDGR